MTLQGEGTKGMVGMAIMAVPWDSVQVKWKRVAQGLIVLGCQLLVVRSRSWTPEIFPTIIGFQTEVAGRFPVMVSMLFRKSMTGKPPLWGPQNSTFIFTVVLNTVSNQGQGWRPWGQPRPLSLSRHTYHFGVCVRSVGLFSMVFIPSVSPSPMETGNPKSRTGMGVGHKMWLLLPPVNHFRIYWWIGDVYGAARK